MGTSEYEMLERLLDERFETLKSSMSEIKETQDAILHRLNAQELANASRESTWQGAKRVVSIDGYYMVGSAYKVFVNVKPI